ncbi:hypothetical protein FNV43_RR01373 [Rhamnella rubrinervis]|uniref:Leucine-rich repeat-containing N-terminal plant-type domain-containing protein n=1 Tax=Rhamnella rubrinervis TaxID=2594499 RepID=A0A8K0HSF4_9ROSA|nr:hypothetical protein FNV43_RR01373 [Rhamnella rubrinervis]
MMKSISLQHPPIIFYLTIFISCYGVYVSCTPNVSTTSSAFKCLPHRSTTLLQFKQEFSLQKPEFSFQKPNFSSYYYSFPDYDDFGHPRMKFGEEGKDCCSWDGVTCDVKTGQVVGLNLSYSWLQGPLRSNSRLFKLRQLQQVNLSFNNFSFCQIPTEFGQLSRLTYLVLSYSMFSGKIPSEISYLTNMAYLDLSFFCEVWTQDQLEHLVLSNNGIEGRIPKWFWAMAKKKLDFLDLSGNKLQGSLNAPPLFTSFFDISENNLSGKIHPSFRNWTNLKVLDMSENNFSGTIPQWLCIFGTSLEILNLYGNNFHGSLPQMFTNGSMLNLKTLDLSDNQLQGKVLQFLRNCSKLQVLNLEHNQISDTFPFCGSLPSEYFINWVAMIQAPYENKVQLRYMQDMYWEKYYPSSIIVVKKGLKMKLVRIPTTFICIDLSSNRFDGEIPSSIVNLRDLVVLNLSSNSFNGSIPLSLGNIRELESLDLSKNKLSGRIPQQLTDLTFLEYLNLSQNQLTGPIPRGRQLDTFSSSCFEENPGLCGRPLSRSSENAVPPIFQQEKEVESEVGFTWKPVVVGYGFGIVVGFIVGHVALSQRRPT